jgi:hypothetical protein
MGTDMLWGAKNDTTVKEKAGFVAGKAYFQWNRWWERPVETHGLALSKTMNFIFSDMYYVCIECIVLVFWKMYG